MWIALALSVVMLGVGSFVIDGVTAPVLGKGLALPLVRLLILIAVGLAIGQTIEAAGWTHKLGKLAGPLFGYARLGPRCSAAFATAFISGAAANAMLYEFWQDEKINKRQLFLTNLANQLPAYFLHLPTTVFIVLPLTGWAGGLYFLLTFIAAVIRLAIVLIFGHLRPICDPAAVTWDDVRPKPIPERRAAIKQVLKQKLPRRIMAIVTYVVPIYVAVFLLNSAGLFDWTRQWMARWVVTSFIPIEALSFVVLSFAAEFTSGFAAAGALMKAGVLTTKQTAMALVIGNLVAFPIRALRHQLPRLMGIFAPKTGMQLLALGQGYRITSLIVVTSLYYVCF